jgi:hypothetical protein
MSDNGTASAIPANTGRDLTNVTTPTGSDNTTFSDPANPDTTANGNFTGSDNTTDSDPSISGTTASDAVCISERHFISQNQCLKALVVMCRGLTDGDGPLLDISSEPWVSMKVTTVKPTSKDCKDEIHRRWVTFVGVAGNQSKGKPRPKQWAMPKLLEWLDQNPITCSADIAYLKQKVSEHKKLAQGAVSMKTSADDLLEKHWTGKWPNLRMIHSLVDHDETKRLFLTRYDLDNDRLQVENRNSTKKRATTVWELVSDWWNDPSYSPTTESLPDLHTDFFNEMKIDYSLVSAMAVASPEKCENKFTTMMVDLKRVIANWERSGQGDGGIDVDEDDIGDGRFGSLGNRDRGALDRRHSFVKYHQSYLLYLWHMLDKHNLLVSSLQRLDVTVSASNGAHGVPSVINHNNDTVEDENSVSSKTSKLTVAENFARLSDSIKSLSSSALAMARMEAEQKEKDRAFTHEEKEKDRATTIHLAKIEAEQKLHLATLEAKEKQQARKRERIDTLHLAIEKLSTEKRRLTIEMLSNKKSKDISDYLASEIEEIKNEKKKKETELEDLMASS